MLASELGDVLLQVVLHSRIAEEQGDFDIYDVIAALIAKLTRRHPHVFGDSENDIPSIFRRWEEIKARERQSRSGEAAANDAAPTLVRARKAVFALAKLERLSVLDAEDPAESDEDRAGRRLLAIIAGVWREGLDPELVLRKALDRLHAETLP
jgi:hypothetical protein